MEILNSTEFEKCKNIDFGGGRIKVKGYCNIDIMPFVDGNGDQMVDVLMDVEKEKLPYDDNSIDVLTANNVFEHLGDGFIFALNECHRVLKPGGQLLGVVPVANTKVALADITHKRVFVRESFGYICGTSDAKPDRPAHPRYADYGVLPWNEEKIEVRDDLIYFELTPRKI